METNTKIVDLEKQSYDQLEIITHLEKELASLREQLKNQDATLIGLAASNSEYCKQFREVKDQLKVLEDENRELLIGLHDLFDPLMVSSEFRKLYPGTCKNLESLIHKHKKNLSA